MGRRRRRSSRRATGKPAEAHAASHPTDELTDAEVVRTLRHIQRRVRRLLRGLDKLDATDTGSDSQEPDVLLLAAST